MSEKTTSRADGHTAEVLPHESPYKILRKYNLLPEVK
jgi:hypothetical protein